MASLQLLPPVLFCTGTYDSSIAKIICFMCLILCIIASCWSVYQLPLLFGAGAAAWPSQARH